MDTNPETTETHGSTLPQNGSADWFGLSRWEIAWRVGVFGGLVLAAASIVYNLVVFGPAAVIPGASVPMYLLAIVQFLAWRIAFLMVCAAIAASWLRRFRLWAQAVLFAVTVSLGSSILTVTARLIGSLVSDESLGYSGPAHLRAITDFLVYGPGTWLLLGAFAGWLFAHWWASRSRRPPV